MMVGTEKLEGSAAVVLYVQLWCWPWRAVECSVTLCPSQTQANTRVQKHEYDNYYAKLCTELLFLLFQVEF